MRTMRMIFAVAVMCSLNVAHAVNYDLWEDVTVPVSYEMEKPELQSKFLRVYTMDNCPPCEAWKTQVWPKLQKAGWEEGVNVEFVTVTSNAPRFEWVTPDGVKTQYSGWGGIDRWNAWHKNAMRDIGEEILKKSGGDPAYNFTTEEAEWIHDFDFDRGDVGGASIEDTPSNNYVSAVGTSGAVSCTNCGCAASQQAYSNMVVREYPVTQYNGAACAQPAQYMEYNSCGGAQAGYNAPYTSGMYTYQSGSHQAMRQGPVRALFTPVRFVGRVFSGLGSCVTGMCR